MKKFVTGIAFALVVAAAGNAHAQDAAINKLCPVKGTPVKGVTTDFEGKTIGFC